MTLSELCREIKNWFDVDRIYGTFTITDGTLDLPCSEGQFFRIVGSVHNDGVFSYPVSGLTDETFDGAVWLMAVPAEVLKLADDIGAWEQKYGESVASPYQSESFGGYSYTKASGAASGKTVSGWQDAFRKRLNKWRKI